MPGRSLSPRANDNDSIGRFRCLNENLANRLAFSHNNLWRDPVRAKRPRLRLECITQWPFVLLIFRNAKERCFSVSWTGQKAADPDCAVRGRRSITANQDLHRALQFVSGEQGINHDGCANQWQRHKCEARSEERRVGKEDRTEWW